MIGNPEDITRIRKLLEKNPKGLSIKELSENTGQNRNTIAKNLNILLLKGDADLKQSGTAKNYFPACRIPASTVRNYCRHPYILINSRMEVKESGKNIETLLKDKTGKITGKNIDEILSTNLKMDETDRNYQKALNGQKFQDTITTINGETDFHINVRLLPAVFDNGAEGCAIILADETDAKNTTNELKIANDRHQALANDQTEYMVCRRPDGAITRVNDTYCHYAGKERNELIGSGYSPVIPNGDKEKANQIISTITPAEPVKTLEYRTIQPDGEICHEQWHVRGLYDNQEKLIEYHAVGRDITRMKRLEEQLKTYHTNMEALIKQRMLEMKQANHELMDEITERKKVEQELLFTQFAFDHASDSIIIFDREGRICKANNTSCTLLGYSPEEIKNLTIYDINPEITNEIWKSMWDTQDRQKVSRVCSVHKMKKDSVFPVELSRTFVKFGENPYFCSIARETNRGKNCPDIKAGQPRTNLFTGHPI